MRLKKNSATQPKTRKLQQVSYHEADIRMRSHRLLRLDDNKSVNRLAASCNLHEGLIEAVSSLALSLQISSCSKSDVHSLDAT